MPYLNSMVKSQSKNVWNAIRGTNELLQPRIHYSLEKTKDMSFRHNSTEQKRQFIGISLPSACFYCD